MSSLLSLGFEYKGCHHSFLARVKEDGNKTEYHVTVMNGELEKLLYGNHVITGINGQIITDMTDPPGEQHLLKSYIAKALSKYLHEKSLASY
jgi:hypothetical protein